MSPPRRSPGSSLAAVLVAVLLAASVLLAWRVEQQAGAQEFLVREDLQFAEHGGVALFLDAYLPAGIDLPAVLLIHGGGWTQGSRKQPGRMAERFAGAGFAAFAIDYRLAPEHRFPAQLEDVVAAIEWVRAEAPVLGVDPRRIGLYGSSAGGHLAALAGMAGEGDLTLGSRVLSVATLSGPMDLELSARDGNARIGRAITDLLGCDPLDCVEEALAASPISHLDPTDASLFFANATEELVPLSQAQAMEEELVRQNVPYQLVVVEGDAHAVGYTGRTAPSLTEGQTVGEALMEWFEAQVAASPTRPPPTSPSSSPPTTTPSPTTPPSTPATTPVVTTSSPGSTTPPATDTSSPQVGGPPESGAGWLPFALGGAGVTAALLLAFGLRLRAGRRAPPPPEQAPGV